MEAATTPTETAPAPPPRLRDKYVEEIVPALTKKFGYTTPMAVPRLLKVTVNMGTGESGSIEDATTEIETITGQHPSVRRARKSIAAFKLREGMPIGCRVTLRGARMWEFYDRLTAIALPRIRDFRGVNPDSFDGRGNYNLGLREQTIFPEIDYDAIDMVRGLNVTITTSAGTDEEARELLRALGMPFREEGYSAEELAARRRRRMRKHGGRGKRK